MDVRGQPSLWFDGGEVLNVVAEEPAQVLDEPVEQRSEVQRVPCGPRVVVGVWVGRGAVRADAPVAGAGQGDEHGRAERLAVRACVGLADRPGNDIAPGQVRSVLASAGRAVTPGGPVRESLAAYPRAGDLLVQLADQR